MGTLFDIIGQIFSMIGAVVIIYLLIKAWNGFWHWLFPSK